MEGQRKLALIAASYLILKKPKKKIIKRKVWVKPWLGDYQRLKFGFSSSLEPLFGLSDEYRKYVRMDKSMFEILLQKVTMAIFRPHTRYRLSITPREKLSLTLSYLAEGLPLRRLSYEFRVGVSTARQIIFETIKAINEILVPEYLKAPVESGAWHEIMNDFNNKWNFPACIGALDGKHVHLYPPPNSGTFFYNYKEGFSIVLLALVDANYKFIAIDVGTNGKACDAGIWSSCSIKAAIDEDNLAIPKVVLLPLSEKVSPPVILADSGFALEVGVMRPFPEKGIKQEERVFNYRLSRARRVVENAFGILANRWRILLGRMKVSPEKATQIVLACCALHNMLISEAKAKEIYLPRGSVDEEDVETGIIVPGTWRDGADLQGILPSRDRNPSFNAKTVRNNLKQYFLEEGRVQWQESRIGVL